MSTTCRTAIMRARIRYPVTQYIVDQATSDCGRWRDHARMPLDLADLELETAAWRAVR
jgi:hypothetical protein